MRFEDGARNDGSDARGRASQKQVARREPNQPGQGRDALRHGPDRVREVAALALFAVDQKPEGPELMAPTAAAGRMALIGLDRSKPLAMSQGRWRRREGEAHE
ncbi:MAG TPA: hypothetical protein VG227_07250 [Caulobacteraceae bacterium]|nr:hypothetical protein [Caulobacteraceae bacterium]